LTAIWLGKGSALIELRRFDEAEKIYRGVLSMIPNEPKALAQLKNIDTAYAKQRQIVAQRRAAGTSLEQLDSESFDQLSEIAERQNSAEWADPYLRSLAPFGSFATAGSFRELILPKNVAIDECVTAISPTPDKTRLVFAVSPEGTVQRAWSDQGGYISQCVASKVPGKQLPVPPTSYYLLCTSFEKTGENKSLTTGCGKNRWIESCETRGTTKRCEIRYKNTVD